MNYPLAPRNDALDKSARGLPASTRGGAVFKLIVFLVVTFAVLGLAWMLLLPVILRSTLSKRTGFDVQIAQLSANPFGGNVQLVGLAVNNPPDWPIPEFLQVREFRANTNVWSLLSSRPVIDDAALDVAAVAVVTKQDGTSNVDLFRKRLNEGASDKQKPAKSREFLIRRLEVRFDRLKLADYSGAKPTTREYPVNFQHVYTNVTDAQQIVTGALPTLAKMGLASQGLMPDQLVNSLKDAAKNPDSALKNGKQAGEALKGLFHTLEEKRKP